MANNATNRQARVLVADAQSLALVALSSIVNQQPDMVCCGGAQTVAAAGEAFRVLRPDVVTVDLKFPDGDAIRLIGEMAALQPHIPILVVSQFDESSCSESALQAGAWGYVAKRCSTDEVIAAIRLILNSGSLDRTVEWCQGDNLAPHMTKRTRAAGTAVAAG